MMQSEWLRSTEQPIEDVAVCEIVHRCSHFGNQNTKFSKELKLKLSYDTAISLIGICPKD